MGPMMVLISTFEERSHAFDTHRIQAYDSGLGIEICIRFSHLFLMEKMLPVIKLNTYRYKSEMILLAREYYRRNNWEMR